MSRIFFAFILIALFFTVCSLILGFLALCSRIGSYLSSVLCMIGLGFQTVAAALMTYVLRSPSSCSKRPPLLTMAAGLHSSWDVTST